MRHPFDIICFRWVRQLPRVPIWMPCGRRQELYCGAEDGSPITRNSGSCLLACSKVGKESVFKTITPNHLPSSGSTRVNTSVTPHMTRPSLRALCAGVRAPLGVLKNFGLASKILPLSKLTASPTGKMKAMRGLNLTARWPFRGLRSLCARSKLVPRTLRSRWLTQRSEPGSAGRLAIKDF